MSASATILKRTVAGSSRVHAVNVALDNSYPLGGEALTVQQLGFDHSIDVVIPLPVDGYSGEYDHVNDKLKVRWNRLGLSNQSISVKDDDNAATAGVAVYVHIDEVIEQGTLLAHLEAVNANNADSVARLFQGGPLIPIQDDDNAATGGLALFFDENDTAGLRFSADFDRITGTDNAPAVVVRAEDGSFIRIKDQDNPSGESGTVQVYFDDDAANDYQRLLFVSPTNANGSDRLWIYGGEVPEATDLSAVTMQVVAFGDNPNA